MQVTHLVPLVGGKGHDSVSSSGHPAVDAERGRYIASQITVIAVKALRGSIWLCHEGLHLHIGGCHQRTGHAVQVNALIALVHMKCLKVSRLAVRLHEPRLDLQRTRQHLRQLLASLKGAAQDAQTGCFR